VFAVFRLRGRQQCSGTAADVTGVDERQPPVAGCGDELAGFANAVADWMAPDEVLHEPRRAQNRPLGEDLAHHCINGS
jgi:hypothetical protein